jgi:hypothetical protein
MKLRGDTKLISNRFRRVPFRRFTLGTLRDELSRPGGVRIGGKLHGQIFVQQTRQQIRKLRRRGELLTMEEVLISGE